MLDKSIVEKVLLRAAETGADFAELFADEKYLASFQVTAVFAIGVTLLAGWDSANAQEILKRADDAMYQAKDAGRNQIRFAAQ